MSVDTYAEVEWANALDAQTSLDIDRYDTAVDSFNERHGEHYFAEWAPDRDGDEIKVFAVGDGYAGTEALRTFVDDLDGFDQYDNDLEEGIVS